MNKSPSIEGITLVEAEPVEADARLVMAWRNDPTTRAMSYHVESMSWETFWPEYRDTYFLYDDLTPMFAIYRDQRIGFLRFRHYVFGIPHPKHTVDMDIGINLAPEWRGCGLGTRVIVAATFHMFLNEIEQVVAEIKPQNLASRNAFTKAGYILMDSIDRKIPDLPEPVRVLRYIATRSVPARKPIRWVFLDLDGTLADSLGVLYDVYCEFLSQHGHEGCEREFAELNGPKISEAHELLKVRYQLPGDADALREQYHNTLRAAYASNVKPMLGSLDLIRTLRTDGFRLGLVTASLRAWAQPFIDSQGWTELFDIAVFGDDVSRAKPDPDIYHEALRRAGADAELAIAIEDSPNGIVAATRAGVRVVAFGPKERECELLECGADAVTPTLCEAATVVERLTWR